MKYELQKLNDKYSLNFGGKPMVFGAGCCPSNVVLIGEAPGKDEIKLSRPFVGSAGKNLNVFLEVLNINRESIYITNVVKYRLSKLSEKSGREVNRPATRSDILINQPYLLDEMAIVSPKFIVTLGNVPLKAVTNDFNLNIGQCHGQIISTVIDEKPYNVFPLYHPASIIYNRSLYATYMNDLNILSNIISGLNN